jgi:hypothetical protein
MSKPDWENFAKAVLADWPTGDLEGSVLFDLALQYGMIQEVPGGYNSDHHFDADGVCPEEGDPWYEYTFRGEAGPGLYSIHVLTEQLNTCRMAQTVMDNTVAELERERDDAVIKRAAWELAAKSADAKLAKALEALREWDDLIKHQYSGSREAMSDMTYAAQHTAALLAEIEGEKG